DNHVRRHRSADPRPTRRLAADALALGEAARLHMRRCIGETRVELIERRSGRFLLPEPVQRHGELEQTVWSLRAVSVGLIAFQEGTPCSLVLPTDVVRLAQLILGISGQRIVRIPLKEFLESFLSGPILLLREVAIGELVVLLGIARYRKGGLRAETWRDILAQN